MTQPADYKRFRRMNLIYLVIQIVLVLLLIYMAVGFQSQMQAQGVSHRFLHSVVISLLLQLVLFYPIRKFTVNEAEQLIEATTPGTEAARLKSLRTRGMIRDMVKMGVFAFFAIFIWKAPKVIFVQSILFFSFILTVLSYFQCLSFAIKKAISPKS